MTMRHVLLFATVFVTITSAAPAGDSWSETFRDWRATCFPDGGCEASTGDRGAFAAADTLRLIVERTGADRDGWFVAIEFLRKPARIDRAITLSVNGEADIVLSSGGGFQAYRAATRLYVADRNALRVLLPALLAGDRIQIGYFDVTSEARTFSLSLSGITASLLWIESELKITGSPRVAVPPYNLPAAPPPQTNPVVDAGIPETVLGHHQRTSDCERYDEQDLPDRGSVIQPLSATAILYALPCTSHAYNVTYRLYLRQVGEIGGIRTLYFADYSTATNWSGTDLLFNVSVDGNKLSAFYKGRGLGDCGTSGEWLWQDHNFKLVRYAAQEECRGIALERWPVLFP